MARLLSDYDREQRKSALHLVSAWSSEHRLVLGQVKVADKSNEITAIPALLELLDSLDASSLLMQWVRKQRSLPKYIMLQQITF